MYYKLDENKNVIPGTPEESEKILINKNDEKIVEQDEINGNFISTVFLPIDHNFNPMSKIPIVFETMVFPDYSANEIYCKRYSTWKEAKEGHQRAIKWVKNGCKEDE